MHFKIVVMFIFVICSFFACKDEGKGKIISQVQQTKIRIHVDSLVCLRPYGCVRPKNHVSNADYTYVVYCDSVKCSLCELQRMGIWDGIIKRTRRIGVPVDFLFVFNPGRNNIEPFVKGYYSRKFRLEVYVDTNGIVRRNNMILNDMAVHSFIMDKNGHIVRIGDASKSAEVENEFYRFLKREKCGGGY